MSRFDEPLCPEENARYRPEIEDILGVAVDDEAFEKMAWIIVEQWEPDVMEGPKEHREYWQKVRDDNARYVAYLLRHDLDRAQAGNPYPRPRSERMTKIWKAAQTLYSIDDPAGFLGPSLREMVYIARAIVVANDLEVEFRDDEFEEELVQKLYRTLWASEEPNNPDFLQWVKEGGVYNMFEHRGENQIWETD